MDAEVEKSISNVIEQLDEEGKFLALSQWLLVCERITDLAKERADAARNDLNTRQQK